MSTNTTFVSATPGEVWEVLADGWLYPLWVVGAARMRGVDADWPEVGSKLHHSVGLWPMLIHDNTEVLDAAPSERLHLRTRGWPAGEADVDITLQPCGQGTEVTIKEDVVSGPGALIPGPIKGLTLTWRNTESLRRLAFVAEGRQQSPS